MNLKIGTVAMATALIAVGVQADSFGTGGNAFTLDFVNIGYAGNTADTSGYGAVADSYRMGMHEVTIDQFAKARAADSRIGDGDENPYAIGVNGAASRTSWYEAAKFANYLTTGDAYTGAYQFNRERVKFPDACVDSNLYENNLIPRGLAPRSVIGSGVLTVVDRAAAVGTYGTVYVLPTEDEWYKAAYLKSDGSAYTLYATGDSVPGVEIDANYGGSGGTYSTPWDVGTGNAENNGTFDMNGNVWEWNESTWDGTLTTMDESRVIRGGAFNDSEIDLRSSSRNDNNPAGEGGSVGFRVVAIPEPSSLAMVGVACGLGLFIRRKFML